MQILTPTVLSLSSINEIPMDLLSDEYQTLRHTSMSASLNYTATVHHTCSYGV